MTNRLLPVLLVVGIVAAAGCTTTAPTETRTLTATETPTPTATAANPTATATPTETTTSTATTTSAPTVVPDGDDVPVIISSIDDESHTLHVSVTNESAVLFNDTVTIEADGEQTVATLQGPETTYRVQATLDGQSINETVTLYPGFLESQIKINDSGGLEYRTLVN